MKKLFYILISGLLTIACTDKDVALPKAIIQTDRTEITAPAMETEFPVKVTSNCEWTVSVDENVSEWLSISPESGLGNADVVFSFETNTSEERKTTVTIVSKSDASTFASISITQKAAGASFPVSALRTLAEENLNTPDAGYVIQEDTYICAVVNTASIGANLPSGVFGVQDARTAGSGILVAPDGQNWYERGTELNIPLKDATLKYDENGLLLLEPADGAEIRETDASSALTEPVIISWDDYLSGDYESMYVAVANAQVISESLSGTMDGAIEFQDEDDNRYTVYTWSGAAFVGTNVPSGSGKLSGIASLVENDPVILPVSEDDFALNGARFGISAGIRLPYVFSFRAKGTEDSEGMYYNTMRMSDGSAWTNHLSSPPAKQIVEPNDGSGVQMTFWRSKASSTSNENNGVRFRINADNLDNIFSMQLWDTGSPYPYAQITYPINETVTGDIWLSCSVTGSNYAPRNYTVQSSTDNNIWKNCGDLLIPAGKRNVPHFFSVPVDEMLIKGGFLYIRIIQKEDIRIGGDSKATEGGEGRLHAAIVLDVRKQSRTDFPADAVWSEDFDHIYGGVDYLLGTDKLVNMAVFSGDDISDWDETEKNGMTGENVSARPGYVQIGLAPFQATLPKDLSCNVGQLTTPALSALTETSDIEVSLKAMAYKTGSMMDNAADKDGDKTDFKVEVIGDGTIDGGTSKIISGMNYQDFSDFSFTVNGATPATQLRFTSEAEEGGFTRWFLDDICIVKH